MIHSQTQLEGGGGQENSLKPPRDIYETFVMSSTTNSDQHLPRYLTSESKPYYFIPIPGYYNSSFSVPNSVAFRRVNLLIARLFSYVQNLESL